MVSCTLSATDRAGALNDTVSPLFLYSVFFLIVIGVIGTFDGNVLSRQADVFARQHVTGADAYIFACFIINAAGDAALPVPPARSTFWLSHWSLRFSCRW